MSANNFTYFVVKSADFKAVLVHLRNNFFYDDPLNKSVGLCLKRGQGHIDLEMETVTALKDGVSVAVRNGEGEIVGISVNALLRPGDLEKAKEALKHCSDEKYRKITNIVLEQDIKADFFGKHKANVVFDLKFMSIDVNYRNQRLATELMMRSARLAVEHDCDIIKGSITAVQTKKIGTLLNAKLLSEFDLKQVEGLTIEPPFDKLVVMYRTLRDESDFKSKL